MTTLIENAKQELCCREDELRRGYLHFPIVMAYRADWLDFVER